MPRDERAAAFQEKSDVDDFGDDASNERIAEYAGSITRYFDIELFFGDVDDLVDEETDRSAVFREHENRLSGFEAEERHQLVAVFHNVSAIGHLDVSAIDLLDPAHERKRYCFRPVRRRAKNQKRDSVLS